jgi:hypothetical protein
MAVKLIYNAWHYGYTGKVRCNEGFGVVHPGRKMPRLAPNKNVQ